MDDPSPADNALPRPPPQEPRRDHVATQGSSATENGTNEAPPAEPVQVPSEVLPAPFTRLSPPLGPDAPMVLRLLRTLRRLIEGLYHHDGLSAAPAMAFHFFLSLLPLLVVVGWVVGHVARTRGLEVLFDPIFETAPSAVAIIGRRELERLGETDLSAAPVALGGFLWLASSGVHGMMDAFERALSVPVRRPYWKKRLYSLGFVFFGLLATGAVAFAAVGLESISSVALSTVSTPSAPPASTSPPSEGSSVLAPASSTPPRVPVDGGTTLGVPRLRAKVNRVLALVCFLAVSVSGVAVFYWLAVESPKTIRRRLWPGAMLAIALWLAISWAFGVYVGSLGQYTLYYGSLAAVAVLLMWFWLTSLALLVGAELNAQLEGSRT